MEGSACQKQEYTHTENGERPIGIDKRNYLQIEQLIPFRIMQNINYKLQLAQQNIHKKDTVVQILLKDGV